MCQEGVFMADVSFRYMGDLRVQGKAEGFEDVLITDNSKLNGGLGEHPSPTDLLSSALGTCVLTIMAIRAKKLGVPFEDTKAYVKKEMTPEHRITKFTIKVSSPHSYSEEIRSQLERAAKGCPVHHSLHPDIDREFIFEWAK